MQIGQKNMPSVMQHSFSRIPNANIPRSSFRRNSRHITTLDADYIYPVYVDEVLPADTANIQIQALVRMITPLTPFMDNLYMDMFHFYVPNRLIQTNWTKLMGEQENPDDSIDFATPYVVSPASTGFSNSTLWDYLGIPTQVPDLTVRGGIWRAYNLIWNEWFRDQNLQDSVVVDKDDGPDDVTDYVLLKRGKRHDYFTACLPWPQKGTAIDLPLGTSAPLTVSSAPTIGTGIALGLNNGSTSFGMAGGSYLSGWTSELGATVGSGGLSGNVTSGVAVGVSTNAANSGLETDLSAVMVDLTSAAGATINSLYRAFAIQDLLQTDARGGTRYTELIRAHFGVTSPDSRLQRPEYLGGGSFPIMVTPLAQTSETNTSELGTLAATATGVINGNGYVKSFTEHGVVLTLMCIRADLTYQQGLPRMYSRATRYDYYFPALANLGEQGVLNKEIYAQGTSADDDIFGYQERWSEYRYGRSMISSKMRSNDAQSLDVWHLAEEFDSLPALNDEFIVQNTPIDRVTAVTNEPQFKADFFISGNWVRPMPLYSVPGLMNRF